MSPFLIMVIAAIAYFSAPDADWPVWRHIWYFDGAAPGDFDTAEAYQQELVWFQRTMMLDAVIPLVAAFVPGPGVEDGPTRRGYLTDPAVYDWPPQREGLPLAPWTHHLRLTGGRYPGNPVHWMLRGCLTPGDVEVGEGNRLGLVNRPMWDAALATATGGPHTAIFGALKYQLGGGTWPALGGGAINALVVGGATRLNAQRRAMSRHVQAAVQVQADVVGSLTVMAQQYRDLRTNWYNLDLPDFYPASTKDQMMTIVNAGKAAGEAVQDWIGDEDPGQAGNQVKEPRYLMTTSGLAAAVADVGSKAGEALAIIQALEPFTSGGWEYLHRDEFRNAHDATEDVLKAAAPLLAYDYLDSTLGGGGSTLRGGYLPLLPDVDPAS